MMANSPQQVSDIPRFTAASYMRDHLIAIVFTVLCEGAICCILPVLGLALPAIVLIAGVIFACAIAALTMDYLRKRRFYRELFDLFDNLEQAIGVDSLIERPLFLEGGITYEVASTLSRLSAKRITDMKADDEAYRRYIELWIHEIKTPIAAIRLMLANSTDEQSFKISRELERVENQVDQALYYARSTSVANDYAIKEINLSDAVKESCKRNARFLIEHRTTPVFEIDPNLTVLTDEAWLIFMLGQVVVNASKYGASTITFSAINKHEDTAYGCSVLEIRDDGCGIPASDISKVFERGFIGSVGREQGSATGMGLHLVAKLCASLGLHVGLASEEGVGTRVIFTFPHDRARKRLMALA